VLSNDLVVKRKYPSKNINEIRKIFSFLLLLAKDELGAVDK
jgi:hypothetical protein